MLTPDQVTAARQSMGITPVAGGGAPGAAAVTPQSRIDALDAAWGNTPAGGTSAPVTPPAPSMGDIDAQQLSESANKIISSITEAGNKFENDTGEGKGLNPFQGAKGVGDILEGLLGAGAGIVQGVSAPVTAVLQKALEYDPAKATPGTPDAADPDGKMAAAGQAFATAHPELVQNLRDSLMVGGALFGGEEGIIPGGSTSLSDFAATGKGLLQDAAGRVKAGLTSAPAAEAPVAAAEAVKPPIKAPEAKTSLIGNIARSGAAHAIGVQPATISEILKNPDLYTTEKMGEASRQSLAEEVQAGINKKVAVLNQAKEGAGVSPRALGDQVNTALTKRQAELEQSARQYGEVTGSRTPGSTEGPNINVDRNFLDKEIAKATGRQVKNGVIDNSPNLASSVRDPKDISALQKFLDTRGPAFKKGTLSGNEFLNLRDDLTGLSHFDKAGGAPSTALEQVGKGVRARLNDLYRPRFKGLEDADAQYEKNITDLNRLKTGLIDNNGELSENTLNRILSSGGRGKDYVGDKLEELVPGIRKQVKQLKDIEGEQARVRAGIVDENGNLLQTAANHIANAGGLGKDLLSSTLEEVAPGINDKIRFLKTVEDIKSAKGIKTGSYIKAGLTLVNGPFGVAAFILTHPDVAVPLLRKLGASGEDAAKISANMGLKK